MSNDGHHAQITVAASCLLPRNQIVRLRQLQHLPPLVSSPRRVSNNGQTILAEIQVQTASGNNTGPGAAQSEGAPRGHSGPEGGGQEDGGCQTSGAGKARHSSTLTFNSALNASTSTTHFFKTALPSE